MTDNVQFPRTLVDILNGMDDTPLSHGAADGDHDIELGQGWIRAVPPTAGTSTFTLPGVLAAKGQEFLIESFGNDTGTVTVEDRGDSSIAWADVILTADKDYVLVKSMGTFWETQSEVST